MLVQVDQGLEDLIEEALGLIRSQWIISALSHEFLEIVLEVFENQVELVLRIDYFLEPLKRVKLIAINLLNDVRVLDAFEQRDLSDGGRRDSIVFFFQSDLLESYELTSHGVSALVYDTIGTFSKFLKSLVSLQL